MTSPFILKVIVNSMTAAFGSTEIATAGAAAGVAVATRPSFLGGPMTLVKSIMGIGLWGLTRITTNTMLCYQMNYITEAIQAGIRRISSASFKHLHKLDLNYHKQSSKNTVFGINRALRSIDTGLRLFMGLFSQMVVEFVFLCGALTFACGPKYLLNMLTTFAFYTWFTFRVQKRRIKEI